MAHKPAADAALTREKSGTPSVAVAFGCGGARGLAHIQVIEALDELGIRPVAIAGASFGAIVGAAHGGWDDRCRNARLHPCNGR